MLKTISISNKILIDSIVCMHIMHILKTNMIKRQQKFINLVNKKPKRSLA